MSSPVALYSVLLYVKDVEASLSFYRDLLDLQQLGPIDDGVAVLDAGGCRVVLHPMDGGDWPAPGVNLIPGGHALSFEVDDPDAWAKRLPREGIEVVRGPLDQVWGRVVFVRDPDGRTVALARPARFGGA